MKFIFGFFVSVMACNFSLASDLKYIGKCSWDAAACSYSADHAIAEFYLQSITGAIYVSSFISDTNGSLCERPQFSPSEANLQLVGQSSDGKYLWDNGESQVQIYKKFGQVFLATNGRNKLEKQKYGASSVYPACFFENP